MKKTITLTLLLILALCLTACNPTSTKDPWEDAAYTEDTEFGEGAKTVTVEVRVNDHSVIFTLHTDREILGEALLDHDLIAGEESQYGLYVKVVNGITADYDADQSYWQVCVNGEEAMTGVDGVEIADGAAYGLVYKK